MQIILKKGTHQRIFLYYLYFSLLRYLFQSVLYQSNWLFKTFVRQNINHRRATEISLWEQKLHTIRGNFTLSKNQHWKNEQFLSFPSEWEAGTWAVILAQLVVRLLVSINVVQHGQRVQVVPALQTSTNAYNTSCFKQQDTTCQTAVLRRKMYLVCENRSWRSQ